MEEVLRPGKDLESRLRGYGVCSSPRKARRTEHVELSTSYYPVSSICTDILASLQDTEQETLKPVGESCYSSWAGIPLNLRFRRNRHTGVILDEMRLFILARTDYHRLIFSAGFPGAW